MPRAMTRVYLPDGRYKTIVVESDQTVRDLIPVVTEKFQATSTENFSNYVLFESLDNEKVLNELSLTSRPYDITIQWKPESNNRLIFKRTNQSVLVHDTGFVPPPSTTVLPDAPKYNPPRSGSIPPPYTPNPTPPPYSAVPPSYSAAPQGQPPIPVRKLPTGAQPLFTPGATAPVYSNTMRRRAPSDATPQGPTQSYQPVNAPSGNTAELQERLNKMRAAEQEKKTQDVVQKQSIAVWCNYHLKSSGAEISDIVSDFANGENFALLIQALTQRPIKINQNPTTYQQKMENLRGSFAVLESIGAKPRGCGPEDFLNGNEKAIMGLLLLLVGKFKDVSKRASSRFSTILTSQGAAVSSAPSRPPPQRPPRPPGQDTMGRPIPGASNPVPTPQPSYSTSPPSRPQPGLATSPPARPQPGVATNAPARPQPAQPPARPTPAPKTTGAPPPSSAPPQQPPPAQPSRPVRPAVPPRSSLDPEATSTTTKQSTPVPPKPSTMRDRPTSAADSTPALAPKTTTAPPAFQPPPPKTPTKQSSAPPATSAPPAESTGKSPFSQPLPARTNPTPAPAPVKRPAPPPVKAKAAAEPQPVPQPTPPPPQQQQKPEEDEFALDELDQMMDTIQNTSSFIAPPPAKEPEAASSKTPSSSSSAPPTSFAKFPTLDDEDDLGEITLLAESLSEITTAPPSGNLPIRKLSNAVLPTVQPTPTPTTTAKAPSPAPAPATEEEPHFEDFDELEDFLADLANELGVQLGEMDANKPKDNNDLNSLDLNFDI